MSLKWKRSFFCKWWCTVKFPYFRWFQVGPYVEIFFIYSCDRILAPEKLILGENNFIFSLLLASAINTHVQTLPTLCLDCHRTYRHVNTHNLFLIGRYTLALTQTQSQPQISCITSLAVPMPVHSEGGTALTATHTLSLSLSLSSIYPFSLIHILIHSTDHHTQCGIARVVKSKFVHAYRYHRVTACADRPTRTTDKRNFRSREGEVVLTNIALLLLSINELA